MKSLKVGLIVLLVIIVSSFLLVPVAAKSLYVIGDVNGATAPINSYDIGANGIPVWQTVTNVPMHSLGAVGIAIDTDSETLFITYESSNVIELIDAKTMQRITYTTAPGAGNLAGIVCDQEKHKVYTVDRGTSKLYVYTYNPVLKTLTLDGGTYKTLTGATAWGIALDEKAGILYTANDNVYIKKYSTSGWASLGDITLPNTAVGVAVDVKNGLLYAGNANDEHHKLIQYNLNTGASATVSVTEEVVGLAVDPSTSRIYITTGDQQNSGTTGWQQLSVYDSSLARLWSSNNHLSKPTGLCIPGKDISYNPLNLDKGFDDPLNTVVYPGATIIYNIDYQNTNPTPVTMVIITDTLPSEVTFVSATGGGTYDSATHKCTWNLGTLAPGQVGSVKMTVLVKSATPVNTQITNYATISSTETGQTTQSDEDDDVTVEDPPNAPPVADAKGPYTGSEGTAVVLDGSGSSDPDAGDSIVSYEWDLDGDGVFDDATGINPSFTWNDEYSGTISLKVTDSHGESSIATSSATISNVAPTATFGNTGPVDEGSPFTLSLTSPYDPSSVDTTAGFQYAFDCGDGSGYGSFSTTASATCIATDNNEQLVKGKIKDKDGGESEYTGSVTVNNVVPYDLELTLVPASPINENDETQLTGTFKDPGTADTHVVEIDWGDGSTKTTVTLAAGVLTFGPTHKYLDDPAGTTDVFTISVKVTDKDTEFDEATQAITVNNVAPYDLALTLVPASPINENDEAQLSGTFKDPGTADTHVVEIDWGDGSTKTIVNLAAGVLTFGPTHKYLDDPAGTTDVYTISVKVTDKDNAEVSKTQAITVNNVAPTVTTITNVPVEPVATKTATGITGTFTDPGTKDTHTATWTFVAFDTQSTCAGVVTESGGSGSVSVNSACIIPPNVYDSITLTVTDKDGGVGTKTVDVILVIYDPNGGFVTGGGWINSPSGAYVPDSSLSGKATFGFVSKYQKGATVPIGNTQFVFHAANMDFRSSSYQWLVVAGPKAMYKGTGTIDNKGNYGFILSAIDGQVKNGGGFDKFRIKITDKSNNDVVVYDNQIGAVDDYETPTTTIAGGSIVIHA